jgi:type II secretory pathway component PulJ
VAANILPANRRSIALVEALGFAREGLLRGLIEIDGAWRDHECWSVLSTEWRGGALDRTSEPEARRRTRSSHARAPEARSPQTTPRRAKDARRGEN